ncbi:hypothetical protein QFZ34_001395 [Phyllobacterium ifriqiyense]|uniref:Uncharacterized protein n=1 Tax=Phyllobacterium ifriqiyense TaxID=314238 RepID=A0ABU0S910_9HYPH|nr:hypothetical protein [Phyllobacterium ifriqiyense]MDQ0996218.1 hypothetical protein [Phyllobacterium ifriqiyense]
MTYDVVLKACRMAAQGVFQLPSLRESLRRYLIKAKVLANIVEVPAYCEAAD